MLSHVDARNQPTMVDVSGKAVTRRTAHARARVLLPPVVRAAFAGGDIQTPKGPAFISTLRKKVDATTPRLIHTVRGVGYTIREP